MAIKANTSTILNKYTPPFKKKGDFLNNNLLLFDSSCQAFVNVSPTVLQNLLDELNDEYETVEFFSAVGDGTQVGYILPWVVEDTHYVIVTLDGLKQDANTYTTTVYTDVTLLTFSEVIPNETVIEVLGFNVQEPKQILEYRFTGDGIIDEVTIPWVANNERALFITMDGLKQHSEAFTITWQTNNTSIITFSEVIPDDADVEILGFYQFNPNMFRYSVFEGDDVEDTFSIPWHVPDSKYLYLTIDGLKQSQDSFTVNILGPLESEIVLSEPLPDDSEMEIFSFDPYLIIGSCNPACDNLSGTNLGAGAGVFNSITTSAIGTQLSFRSLIAGTGIDLTVGPSTIEISTDLDDFPTFENVGAGEELLVEPVGSPVQFKSLVAGAGVTLNASATEIEIEVDSNASEFGGGEPGDYARYLADAGNGLSLIKKANATSNSTFELHTLRGGSGIFVTLVNDEIIISDANGGNYHQTSLTYEVTPDDAIVGTVQATPISILLPGASTAGPGRRLVIKDESGDASTNNITVSPAGGALIDGAASYVISTDYGVLEIYSNGTNWFIID